MAVPTILTAPFKLYTIYSGEENQPSAVASPDGRIATYWNEVISPTDGNIYSYTYQGANLGPNAQGAINSGSGIYTAGLQANPHGTFLANGNAIIVYEQVVGGNRDIYFDLRTKNTDGTYTDTLTSQLVNPGPLATGDQFSPKAARLADGGFAIAWEDASTTTIQVQRYSAAGVANGAAYSFATRTLQTTDVDFEIDLIGLNGGGFAVSYMGSTSGTSNVSVVDGAGVAVVTNQVIPSGSSSFETALAQNSSGAIAIAYYRTTTDVHVQMYNASMVAQGTAVQISDASNSGETPRIAAMLDGRFMVVYSSETAGSLRGQMINANGTLDGAAFTIAANGFQSDIETLADGRVMVTWREGAAAAGDIYGAIYDPRETGVTVTGTAGADNYVGSNFADTFNLGDGSDFILAGGGADSIIGGPNSTSGPDNDTIFGGEGDNTIDGGDLNDLIVGGSGNELLQGGFEGDTIFGEGGNDRIYAKDLANPLGSGVGDVLIGGAGLDSIYGSSGNDYLYGGLDNDSLEGNGGIDVLLGESGNDTMRGGNGNDVFYSGVGVNFMYGDADNDVFLSEGTSDLMEGGTGDNFYYRVAAGSSQANGGIGVDQFIGGNVASDDAFYGNDGNDFAFGGNGNDVLVGQAGNDVLIGQVGNDTLEGGAGVNLLWANDAGNDQIRVVVADGGTQVVEFFEAGGANDVVRLLGSNLTSFAGIQSLVTNIGVAQNGNIMYNTGSGAQLYLNLGANQTAIWFQGVSAYALTSGDFLFG
jgi:Ca2+-binding RTX toxin-like protein